MKEQNRALAKLRKKVDEISAEKKAEDKLLELQAHMERESTACRELKEELSRVHRDLKLTLEEKNMAKVELEPERVTSQKEMDELRRDLEQALAERDEVEKQADDDMEKLQNDLQLFKVMKYKEGYCEGA